MNQTPRKDDPSAIPYDWDMFLARRLEEFESTLQSEENSHSPELKEFADCPPEIVAELADLLSTLRKLENFLGKRGGSLSPVISNPDSEPSTLPLQHAGSDTYPISDSRDKSHPYSDLRLGRFEIGHKLGEGTYGIVYLAHDPRLKRLVALKIPRLDAAFRDDLHERFVREGESAARLTHPNIVTVYEALSEGPVTFIASEYISGPNLANWLSDHPEPVDPKTAARLIANLAEGVAHAHARQVLHRDIKPSNILLAPKIEETRSLEDYVPKLTDFGLAKLLETQDATLSGAIVGTPAYMPPEQIAGKSSEIGPAVDVYSLGMVLYQLLTGKSPFLKQSIGETIHAVTSEELPKPSSFHRNVPRDVETICLKCLRREKTERYASAADLAADLERYLGGHPIQARDVSVFERAVKWCGRYPALTMSALGIFLLLAILLISSTSYSSRLSETLKIAEFERAEALEKARALRRRVYSDDMQAASNAWTEGNVLSAESFLREYLPGPGKEDIRTAPWWILWHEMTDRSVVMGKHEGEANSVAITPDGRFAATGGKDALIRIWDLSQKKEVRILHGHELGPVASLQFSRDGIRLISAAEDGTLRIWNWQNGIESLCIRTGQGWISSALFSPDEKLIASGGEDTTVRLWNSQTGLQEGLLTGHTKTIRSIDFHPTDQFLVSSSQDNTVRVWDLETLQPDTRFEKGMLPSPDSNYFRSVKFRPDGNVLAGGGRGGKLVLWSFANDTYGRILHEQLLTQANFRSVSWNDNQLLGAGLTDHRFLLGVQTERSPLELEFLSGHKSPIMSVAFIPNHQGAVTCGQDGEVRFWPQSSLTGDVQLPTSEEVEQMGISWNGDYLASGNWSGRLIVANASSGELVDRMHVPTTGGGLVSTTSRKDIILVAPLKQPGLSAYSASSGDLLWHMDLKADTPPKFLKFDSNESRLIIDDDSELLLIDVRTGELLLKMPHGTNYVTHGQFVDKSVEIVSTDSSGHLNVWDSKTGKLKRSIMVHANGVNDFALSPDAKQIVTAGIDRSLAMWDFNSLNQISVFGNTTGDVEVYWLKDGHTLLVIGDKEGASFYDIPDERRVLNIPWTTQSRAFAISPDKSQFAVHSLNRIRIYRMGP